MPRFTSAGACVVTLTLLLAGGRLAVAQDNLAPSGTAFQDSTGFGGVASRAIDGNTDGMYGNGSVSHNGGGNQNSYWQVNLPNKSQLNRIDLYNRADCCGIRLSNFRASVLNNGTEVFGRNFYEGAGSVPQGGSESIVFPEVLGDAVRVQFLGVNNEGNGVLSLAEVETYGTATLVGNVALRGTASQSTTDFGGDASRGNDGNSEGHYGNGSVTHTDVGSRDNWWQVALDNDYYLYDVNLYNRSDFDEPGGRLSNFRVSILDDGAEVFGQNFFEGTGSVAQGGMLNVPVGGVRGDTVRVQNLGLNNAGNGILSLAELQAFGSVELIPEPGTLPALGVLGLLALWRRRQPRI
jgi:hypothetical protein